MSLTASATPTPPALAASAAGVAQAYGVAISEGGAGEATARSNRAAAYLKLNKHREALQDASAALRLEPTEIACYRKG